MPLFSYTAVPKCNVNSIFQLKETFNALDGHLKSKIGGSKKRRKKILPPYGNEASCAIAVKTWN